MIHSLDLYHVYRVILSVFLWWITNMRRRHRETFTTIKAEGNLLPIDLLHRIVVGDRDLEGLTRDSYHPAKNDKANEGERPIQSLSPVS